MNGVGRHNNLPFLLAVLFFSGLVLFSISRMGGDSPLPKGTKKGSTFFAEIAVKPAPELRAHAYLVRIAGGDVLLKRREWKRMAPASLTKVLTALIAFEELSSGERVSFSQEAKETEEKRSSAGAGEAFFRDDVIRMALLGSFNDAALSLAEAVGKKRGRETFEERLHLFVSLMNKKGEVLGLDDTHFENPVGLDAESHYSSAEDLARFAEYIWYHAPALWGFTRAGEVSVVSQSGREYTVVNTNELLQEFPAILGGKTGYTDKAKGNLLFFYPVRPAYTAIVVLLRSDERFEDGRKVIRWLEEMAR